MKNTAFYVAVAITIIGLTGCSKPKVNCADQTGLSSISEILKKEITKQLEDVKSSDGSRIYTQEPIQKALEEIGISIENIRTSKNDENTTKVQCEASLKLSPSERLKNEAMAGAKLLNSSENIDGYAKKAGFDIEPNSYIKAIEYSFQPTDDGSKIVTTVADVKPIGDFVSDLIAAAIIKPLIEKTKDTSSSNSEAKQTEMIAAANLQISEIEVSLDLFKLDVGRYPTADEGLMVLADNSKSIPKWNGPYLKSGLPKDPWGENYHYQNPGRKGAPDVFSYGADKKQGGEGFNADIFN